MSNREENPNNYAGFHPGRTQVEGDVVTKQVAFDLPNGREAMVGLKIGLGEPADRAKQREEFLHTVYPPALTEGLEKDLARLTQQFEDYTGFDRQGQPIMRVQGRDREILEMKLANRRNALATARQERALAERAQAQARATKQAEDARIHAAAQAKAQQLIEQAEIDRQAKQIAARAGVRD